MGSIWCGGVRSYCCGLLVQHGGLLRLCVTQVTLMHAHTHIHTQCLQPGVLPADRQCQHTSPPLRPGCRGEREGDKMRHKQVDGCSLFSALASAVSLNLYHTLCAPTLPLTHTQTHAHTHTHAPEKLVTQASPITETHCMYAHILPHTLLTESERWRDGDIC